MHAWILIELSFIINGQIPAMYIYCSPDNDPNGGSIAVLRV